MDKNYFVYIIASRKNGTLYIGLTSNLAKRIHEHKSNFIEGFTKKYRVNNLVHYEVFSDVREATHREKQLKWWRRDWKKELIEAKNPQWADLYLQILSD